MARTITFALVNRSAVERVELVPTATGWTASITYFHKSATGEVISRQTHTKVLGPAAITQIDTWLTNQLSTLNTDEGLT